MKRGKASIKQISEMTGFSATTVFNALNGKGGVSNQTARTILEAASQMQYVPKGRVGRLKMVVYKESGAVVDDTPFFTQLFAGVGDESRKQGYNLEISYISRTNEDYKLAISRTLLEDVDGVILIGTELKDSDISDFEHSTVPLVLCDNHIFSSELSSVSISNKDSAQHAVNYLIKCGHRSIGYLKSSFRINNFQEREEGLRLALMKGGLSEQEQFYIPLGSSTDGAYRDMNRWLEGHKELPTAFFADNDLIAFGAMKAISEHGYRIPEDVSVIGFDDMPFCEVFSPPLTTLRVFKAEMGRRAVRRLVEIINGREESGSVPITTHVGTQLVIRGSVKNFSEEKGRK